ncbi:MAG: transglycosylase SLT domain-containing protein, partial [Bdellovibrionota bacterium]
MFLITWFTLLIPLFASADADRFLLIAPARESFPFNSDPAKNSGCIVSLPTPAKAKILSETPTHFEVEWGVELRGCLWQQMFGQNLKRGFVRKTDIVWDENLKATIPMLNFKDRVPDFADTPVECLDALTQKFVPLANKDMNVTQLIEFLRREGGGIKPLEKIDQYQRCYPNSKIGLVNYIRYKKFMDLTGDVFRITERKERQDVDPSLLGCLFRRESGFDVKDVSSTGAAGLGQHTNVNINEISGRLKKPGSWEGALWRRYFEKAKETVEGRAMLATCPGSSKNGEPVFDTKQDAMCPLQSMAAASIYILMIQRELSRNSKIYAIDWENELEYQTAIAAAYNLGEGAAGAAVKNLLVQDWVGAIRKKSTQGKKGKDCEVMLHVNAIRHCLQNKDP